MQSIRNKQKCPQNCQDHLFLLENKLGNNKYDAKTTFCPKPRRPPHPPEKTMPQFNLDKKHYTSAFVLGTQKKSISNNTHTQFAHFQSQVKDALQKNNQILFPRPNQKNNYCSVCKQHYQNYYEHIREKSHQQRIDAAIYNTQIHKLCESFRDRWQGAHERADGQLTQIYKRLQNSNHDSGASQAIQQENQSQTEKSIDEQQQEEDEQDDEQEEQDQYQEQDDILSLPNDVKKKTNNNLVLLSNQPKKSQQKKQQKPEITQNGKKSEKINQPFSSSMPPMFQSFGNHYDMMNSAYSNNYNMFPDGPLFGQEYQNSRSNIQTKQKQIFPFSEEKTPKQIQKSLSKDLSEYSTVKNNQFVVLLKKNKYGKYQVMKSTQQFSKKAETKQKQRISLQVQIRKDTKQIVKNPIQSNRTVNQSMHSSVLDQRYRELRQRERQKNRLNSTGYKNSFYSNSNSSMIQQYDRDKGLCENLKSTYQRNNQNQKQPLPNDSVSHQNYQGKMGNNKLKIQPTIQQANKANPNMYNYSTNPNFHNDYMRGSHTPENRAGSSSMDRQPPPNINPRFPGQGYPPYPQNYYNYQMRPPQYNRMMPYNYNNQFPPGMNTRMPNKSPDELQKQYMGQMGKQPNKHGSYPMPPFGNWYNNQYMMPPMMRNRQDQPGYDRSGSMPHMKQQGSPQNYMAGNSKNNRSQQGLPPNPFYLRGYPPMNNRYMGYPSYGNQNPLRKDPNMQQPSPYGPKSNWDKTNPK